MKISNLLNLKNEIEDIEKNLQKIFNKIINFVNNNYCQNKANIFYGHAFLLPISEKLEIKVKEKIFYDVINTLKNPKFNTHFEFLKVAIGIWNNKVNKEDYQIKELTHIAKVSPFRNNNTTNWTLLRYLAKILLNDPTFFSKLYVKMLLLCRIDDNFIKDRKRDYSLQYHWFSTYILLQIYRYSNNNFFLNKFLKCSEVSENAIISNCRLSYFGRGQEQLFSYAAALNVLLNRFFFLSNVSTLEKIKGILKLLLEHISIDGYIPLMLSQRSKNSYFGVLFEPLEEKKFDFGWYRYNNFWDYFGFFTYLIYDSLQLLKRNNFSKKIKNLNVSTSSNTFDHKIFTKIDYKKDIGIFYTRIGNKVSQDLFFPYIVYKGRFLLPIPGGEEYRIRKPLHLMTTYPFIEINQKIYSLIKKSYWKFERNIASISTSLYNFKRKINTYMTEDELRINIVDFIKINKRIDRPMKITLINIPTWFKIDGHKEISLLNDKISVKLKFPEKVHSIDKTIETPLGMSYVNQVVKYHNRVNKNKLYQTSLQLILKEI